MSRVRMGEGMGGVGVDCVGVEGVWLEVEV